MLIIFLSGLCVAKLHLFTSQYCLSSMQHYAVCLWLAEKYCSVSFVQFEAFVSLRMIKKPFSYVVLVFSRAQQVQALHGFYRGFNVFVKRGVLFFPAKMSRKLSLPTELKPDLGKPWLCVHAIQLLNVESISTLSETGGSTCSLALNISCQLAQDYGGFRIPELSRVYTEFLTLKHELWNTVYQKRSIWSWFSYWFVGLTYIWVMTVLVYQKACVSVSINSTHKHGQNHCITFT